MAGQDLARVFFAEPDLGCVVVERAGGWDMLTRQRFLSGSPGRPGFAGAVHTLWPVASFSGDSPALVLSAALTLIEAGRAAMGRPLHCRYDDIVVADGDEASGVVSFARLLAELSELHADRAKHDPLTGLPNRTLLFERLETALATERDRSRACLLFIDSTTSSRSTTASVISPATSS